MKSTFTISGRFCSLNEFYRMDRYQQWQAKKDNDDAVAWSAKAGRVPKFSKPVKLLFKWVEPNRKRDLDNVAFGKKFVQDGLVKAGVLTNDTHHEIAGFEDSFAYDKLNPRIEVTITDEL